MIAHWQNWNVHHISPHRRRPFCFAAPSLNSFPEIGTLTSLKVFDVGKVSLSPSVAAHYWLWNDSFSMLSHAIRLSTKKQLEASAPYQANYLQSQALQISIQVRPCPRFAIESNLSYVIVPVFCSALFPTIVGTSIEGNIPSEIGHLGQLTRLAFGMLPPLLCSLCRHQDRLSENALTFSNSSFDSLKRVIAGDYSVGNWKLPQLGIYFIWYASVEWTDCYNSFFFLITHKQFV